MDANAFAMQRRVQSNPVHNYVDRDRSVSFAVNRLEKNTIDLPMFPVKKERASEPAMFGAKKQSSSGHSILRDLSMDDKPHLKQRISRLTVNDKEVFVTNSSEVLI